MFMFISALQALASHSQVCFVSQGIVFKTILKQIVIFLIHLVFACFPVVWCLVGFFFVF